MLRRNGVPELCGVGEDLISWKGDCTGDENILLFVIGDEWDMLKLVLPLTPPPLDNGELSAITGFGDDRSIIGEEVDSRLTGR